MAIALLCSQSIELCRIACSEVSDGGTCAWIDGQSLRSQYLRLPVDMRTAGGTCLPTNVCCVIIRRTTAATWVLSTYSRYEELRSVRLSRQRRLLGGQGTNLGCVWGNLQLCLGRMEILYSRYPKPLACQGHRHEQIWNRSNAHKLPRNSFRSRREVDVSGWLSISSRNVEKLNTLLLLRCCDRLRSNKRL